MPPFWLQSIVWIIVRDCVLPVSCTVFFHRRGAVSHGRAHSLQLVTFSSRASEDFGWGTFPPLIHVYARHAALLQPDKLIAPWRKVHRRGVRQLRSRPSPHSPLRPAHRGTSYFSLVLQPALLWIFLHQHFLLIFITYCRFYLLYHGTTTLPRPSSAPLAPGNRSVSPRLPLGLLLLSLLPYSGRRL